MGWLTIFKNVEMVSDMIQEADEPALETLKDVTLSFSEKNPMGFTLHFHFSPNDYFTNEVLTKTYILKCEPQEDEPFSFEGPEIIKCTGCTIDWKKGKNLTVKQVKKKQKHKSKGSIRTITKQVKADSFFNFFDPPIVPDDPNAEVDEDTQALLTVDFEIGHYIRERIVPRAVLFFTGGLLMKTVIMMRMMRTTMTMMKTEVEVKMMQISIPKRLKSTPSVNSSETFFKTLQKSRFLLQT